MKYKPEFPVSFSDEQLQADLLAAQKVGKVRLGELVLFFSRFAGGTCMPYSEVKHAYIRQEEVNAKLCCGRANFDQFFLMLMGSDGKLRKHQVDDMAQGKLALEHIARLNPACQIGYQKPATV